LKELLRGEEQQQKKKSSESNGGKKFNGGRSRGMTTTMIIMDLSITLMEFAFIFKGAHCYWARIKSNCSYATVIVLLISLKPKQ
jgi:hypothetical protein